MKSISITFISILFFGYVSGAFAANTLSSPTGKVMLTVSGSIKVTNNAESAEFDREMLQKLSWQKINSATAWTTGTPSFEGVLLEDLLTLVGARGNSIVAKALNDYAVTIPWKHLEEHKILLAMKMNGKFMRVRDKGPVWIIYPIESVEEAKGNSHNKFMVWQLDRISIE